MGDDYIFGRTTQPRSAEREVLDARKLAMETTSFLYSIGFVRPLSVKRPVYNLIRAIFFAEA